jgi:hypothetical protein
MRPGFESPYGKRYQLHFFYCYSTAEVLDIEESGQVLVSALAVLQRMAHDNLEKKMPLLSTVMYMSLRERQACSALTTTPRPTKQEFLEAQGTADLLYDNTV